MIINKDVMRDYNERSVLQAIINHGPISRNEVSKQLGLNKVTVSKIIGQLIDQQLITSFGEAKVAGTSGRKPELVAYNALYGYIWNFSLAGDELKLLVTQMDGRPLDYRVQKVQQPTIKKVIQQMETLVSELPPFATDNGLQAISVAIFGVVYQNRIVTSAFVDFEDVDLEKYLTQKYGVPVILENEANAAAIFEQDFSQQELQSLITISIHQGVGAGIILNTQLYRGNYGRAGEIGQFLLPAKGEAAHLERVPNFNAEWSQAAILSKAAQIKHQSAYSLDQFVTAYNRQDAQITEFVAANCTDLAQVTADLIAAYDPQMIFFNSPLIERIPEILKTVQMKLSFMALVPPLVLSKDVKYATLLGGASLAIHRVLDMDGIRLILHH